MSVRKSSAHCELGSLEYAVGLDVGGTKIAAGLVATAQGTVLIKRTIPTLARRGGAAVLEDALKLAAQLTTEATSKGLLLAGIGVAVAELVDLDGNVSSAQTIAWAGRP